MATTPPKVVCYLCNEPVIVHDVHRARSGTLIERITTLRVAPHSCAVLPDGPYTVLEMPKRPR